MVNLEAILNLPSLDIQWGNHDILWMGAFCGSKACLLTLLRIAARYDYLYAIEQAYHINLRHLFLFAERHYQAYTGVTDSQSFQRESQAVPFLEENSGKRKTIRETIIGQELLEQIEDLKILLQRLG